MLPAPERAAPLSSLGLQRGLWLGLMVAALHLALLEQGLSTAGAGAADAPPARIAVAFVHALAPAQPPARQAAATAGVGWT